MYDGTQPATGEKVKLRCWRVKSAPKLSTDPIEEDQNTDFDFDNGEPDNSDEGTGFDIEFDDPVPPYNPNTGGNPNTTNDDPIYHTVDSGDTLFGLSRKYGSSVEQIKELNNMDGNIISLGQKLRVK